MKNGDSITYLGESNIWNAIRMTQFVMQFEHCKNYKIWTSSFKSIKHVSNPKLFFGFKTKFKCYRVYMRSYICIIHNITFFHHDFVAPKLPTTIRPRFLHDLKNAFSQPGNYYGLPQVRQKSAFKLFARVAKPKHIVTWNKR